MKKQPISQKRRHLLFFGALPSFFVLIALVGLTACNQLKIDFSDNLKQTDPDMTLPLQYESLGINTLSTPTVTLLFNKALSDTETKAEHFTLKRAQGGSAVTAFTVTKSSANPNAMLLTLTEPLAENTQYVISGSVFDRWGNRLSLKTNFWTGFFSPVADYFPKEGTVFYNHQTVSVTLRDSFQFNRSTITGTQIYLQKADTEDPVETLSFSVTEESVSPVKITLTAKNLLEEGASYRLVVKGIQLDSGEETTPFEASFRGQNTEIIEKTDLLLIAYPGQEQLPLTLHFNDFVSDLSDQAFTTPATYFLVRDKNNRKVTNSVTLNKEQKTASLSFPNPLTATEAYTLVVENLTFANGTPYKGCTQPLQNSYSLGSDSYSLGSDFFSFAMKQPTFGDDPKDPSYVTVFHDDFSKAYTTDVQSHDATGSLYHHTSAPDPTKWDINHDFEDAGAFKASQVSVKDGKLVITAQNQTGSLNKRPNDKKIDFTRVSGRVQSKTKFGFLYGKVYCKFRLPGPASWPAIWYLSNTDRSKPEMDFIEYYPHKSGGWGGPTKWDIVLWSGTGWKSNVYDRVYNNGGTGNSKKLYEYDIDSVLEWKQLNDKGHSSLKVTADFLTKGVKQGETWTVSNGGDSMDNLSARYIVPMYPIFEIQIQRHVTDIDWNANYNNTPKVLTIDDYRITQPKSKRIATVVDELTDTAHLAKTTGIRQAAFSYPNVEGYNYGRFAYNGQPNEETSLLMVDEAAKTERQSILYKVKNLRGVHLLAYFHPEATNAKGETAASMKNDNRPLNQDTGQPSTPISDYATDDTFDFKMQAATALNGPWTDIPFDCRLGGNDFESGMDDCFFAANYEKIKLPEKTYNYVKILFPKVDRQWNKIFLARVVLTRYEGDTYNDYKIEGE